MSGTWDRYINKILPRGSLLQSKVDRSIPGRTITGYALPNVLQTEEKWFITFYDVVGSQEAGGFAIKDGIQVAEFVHVWADRLSILPAKQFLNEFSIQFTSLVNSYMTVPHSADLNFANTAAFSFSIWWKTSDVSNNTFFQKASNNAGNNGYTFDIDNNGRTEFQFRGTGAGDRIRVRTDSFTSGRNGSWHNAIVTKASGSTAASTVRIYIDGVNQTLNVLNDTLTGSTTNTDILSVGANIGGASRVLANVDEFSIWNLQLTETEAAEVYNTNSGVIDLQSGSGQISSGLVSWWRFGDGSFTTFPTIPDDQGTNDGTLQAGVNSGDIESEVPP